MEYYSVIKRDEVLHATTRMNCKNVMLSERSQTQKATYSTSLVAQLLRIHLPMQGTRVRALFREDPTCCGATKPVYHNY